MALPEFLEELGKSAFLLHRFLVSHIVCFNIFT
jgi:hypothetical protein